MMSARQGKLAADMKVLRGVARHRREKTMLLAVINIKLVISPSFLMA